MIRKGDFIKAKCWARPAVVLEVEYSGPDYEGLVQIDEPHVHVTYSDQLNYKRPNGWIILKPAARGNTYTDFFSQGSWAHSIYTVTPKSVVPEQMELFA